MEKFVSFGMREEIIELDIEIDYEGFLSKIREMFNLKEDSFSVEDLTENNFDELITDKGSFNVVRSEKELAKERLNGKTNFEVIRTVQEAEDFLLVYGFKIDKYGRTPLHWAALNGHVEIVKLLVEKNLKNIRQVDLDRRTPLHWAILKNSKEIVKLLMEKDPENINQKDKNGWTSLHLAVLNHNKEIIKLLLEKYSDNINQVDKYGWTPLHMAVYKGLKETVEILLEIDFDINHQKRNLLFLAAKTEHTEITELLEEAFMKRELSK